jgi:hypothetical protein
MHPKLESLDKLTDDWNQEGAPAPSEMALARAQEILDALTELGIQVDDDEIDPDAAGGVAIYPDIPSHAAAHVEICNEPHGGGTCQVIFLWWHPRYGKGGEPKAVTLHGPNWADALRQVLRAPSPDEVLAADLALSARLKACRTALGLSELRERQVRDLLASCELALEGRDATIDRLTSENVGLRNYCRSEEFRHGPVENLVTGMHDEFAEADAALAGAGLPRAEGEALAVRIRKLAQARNDAQAKEQIADADVASLRAELAELKARTTAALLPALPVDYSPKSVNPLPRPAEMQVGDRGAPWTSPRSSGGWGRS